MLKALFKFSPYIIIALLCVALSFSRVELANERKHQAEIESAYSQKVATFEARARQSEQEINQAVTKANDEYQRGKDESQQTIDNLNRRIAAGDIRLRDERKSKRDAELSRDSAIARANDAERYAVISQRNVENLVRIAKRGDDAIRKSNALIDTFQAIVDDHVKYSGKLSK